MDTDQGKLFIGGISWETTEEKLKDYFKIYGEIAETVIMKDRATGRARGFGFVIFADPSVADRVVNEKHTVDGRTVEAKKAVPRDEQQNVSRSTGGVSGTANRMRTKKIFVGGLASTVTEDDFKKYFEQFGNITDVVVMYDHNTQRPRGFGFITFDSEDAVEKVLQKSFHELNEKMVEVKRAIPKELSAVSGRQSTGFYGGGRGNVYGSGYGQGFSSNPGGYGGRGESRFGPSPGGRSAYGGYGSGSYSTSGDGTGGGYGTGLNGSYTGGSAYGNGAGYTSAGATGYSSASYGTNAGGNGYGGGAAYGSSAAGSGTIGGTGIPVGSRSSWSSTGTGYGSGYGNAGAWGSSSPYVGQAASSGGGYGNGGYGYAGNESGYGSRASGYGNSGGGYGSSGTGGTVSGSYAGGYGDLYGSSGYADSTWKSAGTDSFNSVAASSSGPGSGTYSIGTVASTDALVNGSAGYAGGYGVAGRQSQRGSDTRFRPYPTAGDRTG